MQGQHGEVSVIDSNRHSSRVLSGFCCWGKWPVSPLTAAFHTCSYKYCSSSDPKVLYKCASFREPRVLSFIVTDDLDSPCT